MKVYKLKLVRMCDGFIRFMDYVGPMSGIPENWSYCRREVATQD